MIKQPQIATLAAVALLAGSMVVATATTTTAAQWGGGCDHLGCDQSQGHEWRGQNNDYHRYNRGSDYYNNYDNGGGLVAGLLGGMFAGAIANSYDRPYNDGNACYRFRTYNPATGMYMSYSGPRHCP